MRHLQVFAAVRTIARLGSIRQAAHALSISASALNRQVLALEEEIGAPLFERLPSGVRLSTAGEIFMKCFADHAAELERARAQIADLSGLRAGVVRIGVGPELAARFLPAHVAAHLRLYPSVNFEIQTIDYDETQEKLESYEVDLVLAVNPQLGADVDVMIARDTELRAVTSARAAAAGSGARALRFSDLVEATVLAPARGGGLRNLLDAAFAAKRVAPRYAAETDGGVEALLAAAPQAIRPRLLEEIDDDALAAAGLRAVPFASGVFPTATVRLCRLRARALPVATEQFARHIAQSLD
ncbi:MAG: LysR family transcriptional regulator [Pseudomonadota bacterium]